MQIQIYPDILFLIFPRNICCGNSLAASQKKASNEYLECIFCGEIGKIPVLFGKIMFYLELCT